jgi:hypothetical protein
VCFTSGVLIILAQCGTAAQHTEKVCTGYEKQKPRGESPSYS